MELLKTFWRARPPLWFMLFLILSGMILNMQFVSDKKKEEIDLENLDVVLCITQVATGTNPITLSGDKRGYYKIVTTTQGQMLLIENCE